MEDIKIKSNKGRKRKYPQEYTSWQKAQALAQSKKEKLSQNSYHQTQINSEYIKAFLENLSQDELKYTIKEIKNIMKA